MKSKHFSYLVFGGTFLLLSLNTPVLEALTCSTDFLPFRPLVQFVAYIVDQFVLIILQHYPQICQNVVTSNFFDNPDITGLKPHSPVASLPLLNYSQYQIDNPLSIEELRYYNWFAAAAYCNYRVSNKYPLNCCFCNHFSRPIIYYKVYYNSSENTKFFVTLHPAKKEAVFAFRGTQIQDEVQVLLDFRFDTVNYTFPLLGNASLPVSVHRGFNQCTESLIKLVFVELYRIRLNYPDYRIVIVGHSLGAAMASLTMFRIARQAMQDVVDNNNYTLDHGTYVLITYGQPRVGNWIYAWLMDVLDMTIQRVVNKADIVPHFVRVDQFGIDNKYVHHGQEVWIHKGDSQVKYCSQETWEDATCSMTRAPNYTVSDHVFYFGVDYSQCLFFEDLGFGVLPLNLYGMILNILQKPRLKGDDKARQGLKCEKPGEVTINQIDDLGSFHKIRDVGTFNFSHLL